MLNSSLDVYLTKLNINKLSSLNKKIRVAIYLLIIIPMIILMQIVTRIYDGYIWWIVLCYIAWAVILYKLERKLSDMIFDRVLTLSQRSGS